MEILLLLVMGVVNIACFIIGAKVGQAASRGEKIETPVPNPMQAVRDRQAREQARMDQNRLDTILRNIDSYDGTGRGQEDVPGVNG